MTLLEELHNSFSEKEEKEEKTVKLSENDINAISEKVFAKLTETQKEEQKKDDETEEI